jgi:hypothetical protein
MRVMIFVKATARSEEGAPPTADMTKMFEEMGQFNEALIAAGIMKEGDGLKPTSAAVRVHFDGTSRVVTHGPFHPAEDQVAGYWIWTVKDMDEAIAWVKRCPNPMLERSAVDIRPYYELEDFAGAMTPELIEQEDRQRAALAKKS